MGFFINIPHMEYLWGRSLLDSIKRLLLLYALASVYTGSRLFLNKSAHFEVSWNVICNSDA